jgi:thioredoxin 1
VFAGLVVSTLAFAGCADHHAGPTVEVNDNNFEQLVLQSDKPVLVDFWATWCGPCQMVAPVVADLATDYQGRAVVAKLDVEASPATAEKYAIEGIPTLIVFDGGREVSRVVGPREKTELAVLLDQALQQ